MRQTLSFKTTSTCLELNSNAVKLIIRLNDEIPYQLSVTIEEFNDTGNLIHIDACIWVEKQGQKTIVIGKNGKVLKEIGRLARLELEYL